MLLRNQKIEKEGLVKLGLEELNNVVGGIIIDRNNYFMVINTSGMSTVISRVYYGKKGQLTREAAFVEAQRLDQIDYSTY